MKNKVILFGSSGHLGSHLKENLGKENSINLYCPDRKEVQDILDGRINIEKFKNSFLLNLVSIVGREKLSKTPNSIIELINSDFPLKLAEVCKTSDSKLIHLSSNSVFEDSPERYRYINTELNSKSIYGLSKIKAEKNIMSILDDTKYNIVRTPQQYSMIFSNKRNLFFGIYNKLKSEKNILIDKDEVFTIASCHQISNFILRIIKNDYFGIHHACEQFEYSWVDIAKLLCNFLNLDISKSIKIKIKSKLMQNSSICSSSYGLLKNDFSRIFN